MPLEQFDHIAQHNFAVFFIDTAKDVVYLKKITEAPSSPAPIAEPTPILEEKVKKERSTPTESFTASTLESASA